MSNNPEVLKLQTLLGDHPHVMALKNGQIRSSRLVLDFDDVKMAYPEFKRVVRDLEFDVAELALVTYLQAKAHGKPLVLVPAVIFASKAPHAFIVYNAARGRLSPKDIVGRRVGIRASSVTTVMWARGILQNDYGVDLERVTWVTFEDAHVAEFKDPPNAQRAPAGKKLITMLLEGEVDAAVVSRDDLKDSRLRPLIPDPEAAARSWRERHQMLPINHMLVVKQSLSKSNPWAVQEIFRLVAENRKMAGVPAGVLPLGVEANRKSLALAINYAVQQRLIPRRFEVDELFDDVTRALGS